MTTIETKEARLNELKAELAEIRAEMKDDSISNARWGRLQNYRYEIRCEIEKLQAEIDAEIDANIKKVAAQKVDAILTSGVQPVIVNTTFKNNRSSVNIDGAKVSLDKAVTILCESELARCGENVLLINENFDVCPLDEDLFILGKHNVKTAIRQFARGEKVTGAKVLNGKFYPVVKANAEPAAETAVEEPAIVEVKTASEMKAAYAASRNVVRVHFTAKGNPTWQSIFHYGLHDRETGYQRISKKDAAAELAKFGLTTEQVIAVQKAQDAINAEESEAYKTARNEERCYSRLCYHKVYQKALAMVFGEDEPATVEETAESLPESPNNDGDELIDTPESAPVNIETKIAKNDTLICKFNGKRVAWHNALAALEINPVGTVVAGNGHSYTCITNNVPAPDGLTYETGYLFEDENGNRYIFDNPAFAIRAIAYNTVDEYAVTQDATVEETAIVEPANVEEPDGYNPDVFSLLPKLEDLNDVDGEFDGDAETDCPPESAPVEERKLTRRELEACKNSVMSEIDEYREGLIEYQDDPDVNPTHIDFLKSSIDSKLAEYYDICKQLDELDDEPETPEPKAPSPVETPEPKTVDVKKVSAVVYYTCTADKSNWVKDKYFETTPAAAEWILSFVKTRVFDCTVRDAEIIDRRNGYVRYALTDADITAVNTVNTEPELPTPKPNSPFAIARGLDDVFQKTFHKVDAPYMDVTTQDGAKIATTFGATFISVDWRAVDGYVFGNHFNDVLARYETPEQVTEVMTALRDAIKAGKTEFTFPTVEELTAPPEPDDAKSTFDRVVKTRRHGIGHVTTKQGRHMWYIYGRLVNKKEINEWLADEGFTVEEYIAAEKVADKYEEEVEFPRRMAIREQAEFLWDKIADDRKASVEPMPALYPSDDSDDDDELIDPPEVKAPADEFTAKLAAFDAEITHAETARDAAKAAYEKADVAAQNAIAARQDLLDKTAGALTEKLHAIPPHRDYIGTATLSGCPVTFMDFDNVYVDATLGGKFNFVTFNNRELARYDTPAQVETVIGKLKDAVERHKPVFHFPTVDELNASPEPPKTESVKARKSSLSPSARRYINAREEAQERRIRREYLRDLEQRFYPN